MSIGDPFWREAYESIAPLCLDSDIVLAPVGAWPRFPCEVRFYREIVEVRDANVLILHKGRLAGADKAEIARIDAEWSRVVTNDVFVAYTRERRVAACGNFLSAFRADAVRRYLDAARYRWLPNRIFFLHFPKAGGSSMWPVVCELSRSHIYYSSIEQMLRNPPGQSYDVIGGHFSFSAIAPHLEPRDWVIGLMREPTGRLRSAFLHARRANEDVATFAPAMRAMREHSFGEFLESSDGKIEARLQLVMLGMHHEVSALDDELALAAARSVFSRDRTLFGSASDPQLFLDQLTKRLGVRRRFYRHRNRSDYSAQAADLLEFDASANRVLAENWAERVLYDDVLKSSASHA